MTVAAMMMICRKICVLYAVVHFEQGYSACHCIIVFMMRRHAHAHAHAHAIFISTTTKPLDAYVLCAYWRSGAQTCFTHTQNPKVCGLKHTYMHGILWQAWDTPLKDLDSEKVLSALLKYCLNTGLEPTVWWHGGIRSWFDDKLKIRQEISSFIWCENTK